MVTVRTGFDTERNVHTGFSGTYASQFAVSGLSAVHGAAQKLKAEMKRLGAFVLQPGKTMSSSAPERRVRRFALRAERKPDLFDIVPDKPVEPKVKMPMLPYPERKRNFRLIELGYTQEQAEREAGRCLQCACPAAGQCDLQRYSLEYNLENNRFHDGEPEDYHDYSFDLSHSFILRDPNKCINCTQCVRVCHDVIGPNCYGMFGSRASTLIVSTPFNVSLHRQLIDNGPATTTGFSVALLKYRRSAASLRASSSAMPNGLTT